VRRSLALPPPVPRVFPCYQARLGQPPFPPLCETEVVLGPALPQADSRSCLFAFARLSLGCEPFGVWCKTFQHHVTRLPDRHFFDRSSLFLRLRPPAVDDDPPASGVSIFPSEYLILWKSPVFASLYPGSKQVGKLFPFTPARPVQEFFPISALVPPPQLSPDFFFFKNAPSSPPF